MLMNPPKFLGSQVGEEPHNFINEVMKILFVMQVTIVIRLIGHPTILRMMSYFFHIMERQLGCGCSFCDITLCLRFF